MDAGITRNGIREGNEGTVGNVEKNTVMRTDQVAEERDLVGVEKGGRSENGKEVGGR